MRYLCVYVCIFQAHRKKTRNASKACTATHNICMVPTSLLVIVVAFSTLMQTLDHMAWAMELKGALNGFLDAKLVFELFSVLIQLD